MSGAAYYCADLTEKFLNLELLREDRNRRVFDGRVCEMACGVSGRR